MQCYYEKQRDRHRIMLDHFCMPIEVALSFAAKLESAIMSCKLAIEEDARQDNIEASNSAAGIPKVSLPSGTQQQKDVILAAGNEWYDEAHGGSVDGFIAGVEWALKQTPVL